MPGPDGCPATCATSAAASPSATASTCRRRCTSTSRGRAAMPAQHDVVVIGGGATRDGTDLASRKPFDRSIPLSSTDKPKVAFIGTGGTISSLGIHSLELQDYGIHDNRMHASAIVARFPVVNEIADVIPVDFRNVVSPEIYFPQW